MKTTSTKSYYVKYSTPYASWCVLENCRGLCDKVIETGLDSAREAYLMIDLLTEDQMAERGKCA